MSRKFMRHALWAFDFLVTYHGNGDRQDALVLFEYAEMKEAIRKEKEAKAERWGVILKSPANRHRLGLAMLMTFLTARTLTDIYADVWLIHHHLLLEADLVVDPTEMQTFSMRSKGLLVWNTVQQFEGAYTTFVEAVALDSIG
ncbi:hypothetical protein L198_08228 [Cryptococcus wingfieldii CBS 7118]|uniref:Uncharacterized protein n=1 Tax=Cryptococcus wingfieldii CBS 7118 TaxID=1295528 RepID=A0A1E3HD92_9TREE|nr:hypothetical protein L198_08228 [Cryptococcus wingfieldii CBS 7118]ODN74297.1 hypothetical protein L198_08228 [Cryptococcus wingfieldii CBS 7118]